MKRIAFLSLLLLSLASCGGETVSHMAPSPSNPHTAVPDSSAPPASLQNNIPTH